MFKYLLILLLLGVVVDSARKYIGVREKPDNRSADIDRWNRYVGNPLGSPYCAAFASSMIKQPHIKSGAAVRLITKNAIKSDDVLKGVKVEPGWVVIWRKGNSFNGHAGIVVQWDRKSGTTIEGNTSAGKGSQSNGDGVFERQRKIEPFNYFRITHFTPI
jgi:hypothetical protein